MAIIDMSLDDFKKALKNSNLLIEMKKVAKGKATAPLRIVVLSFAKEYDNLSSLRGDFSLMQVVVNDDPGTINNAITSLYSDSQSGNGKIDIAFKRMKEVSEQFSRLSQVIDYLKNEPQKKSTAGIEVKKTDNIDLLDIYMKNHKIIGNVVHEVNNVDKVQLLKTNRQLILNGAPGTGKTYTAMNEIAGNLIGDIINRDIQVRLVQFHPSYDYTDFIEGIRPVLGDGISYELKNGSFKEFCRNAGVVERILAAHDKKDESLISEENIKKFLKTKQGNKNVIDFWIKWLKQGSHKLELSEIELPKFVFIIDEINRAEISKVLGEVMFSIDADYRGVKGKVVTQFSSSSDENTFFVNKEDDYFFIPSNVYIVGTMNDIDRSVEVFDFALRRRFAWYEIKAKDVMVDVLKSKLSPNYDVKALSDKAAKLNEELISGVLKLDERYYLGPAYFFKIENYGYSLTQDCLEQLWDNHLEQILKEYSKARKISDKTIAEWKLEFITY